MVYALVQIAGLALAVVCTAVVAGYAAGGIAAGIAIVIFAAALEAGQ